MVLFTVLKFLAQKAVGEYVVSSVLPPELETNTKSKLQKQRVSRSLKGKVQVHIPFFIPSCLVVPQRYEETDQLCTLK